jgi:chromate transporter
MGRGRDDIRELAGFFLRLGCTAFGGPAAHIALMELEVVRRRKWLTPEAFLDLLGATNLIPGPNSTQMAMCIGYQRAGWKGLVTGGACFIAPAALVTAFLAWAYVRYGQLPQVQGLLYGVKPVILAIMLQAIWGLGATAFRTAPLVALALCALLAGLLGLHPVMVLIGAGALHVLAVVGGNGRGGGRPRAAGWWLALPVGAGSVPAAGLAGIFLFFLKIGSILYGSGYVLLAFLKADLVDRWHWLSQAQLLDAVAVGQITPGPVFTTATFIGYILGGWLGAVLATVGIFLPSFVFVGFLGLLAAKFRGSRPAAAFLDGVNAGALALMAAVMVQLAGAALVDVWTVAMGVASALLLIRFRISPTWLILGSGVLGLALRQTIL